VDAPAGAHLAAISFPGMTTPAGEQQNRGDAPTYSLEQHIAIISGRHTFKFGGIFTRPAGGRPDTDLTIVSYSSLADLTANNPSQISSTLGTNNFVWHVKNFGLFAQDDWRVSNKLVVNLGLRYDYFGNYVASPVDAANPAGLFNLDGLLDQKFNFGPLRDRATRSTPIRSISIRESALRIRSTAKATPSCAVDSASCTSRSIRRSTKPDRQHRHRPVQDDVQPRAGASAWPALADLQRADHPAVSGAEHGEASGAGIFDPTMEAPFALNFSIGVQRILPGSLMIDTAYVGTVAVTSPWRETTTRSIG